MLSLTELVFSYSDKSHGQSDGQNDSQNNDQNSGKHTGQNPIEIPGGNTHRNSGRRWQFNLELHAHGVYALLGRSGSGKSTLLNLIGGFSNPDSGDIAWNGKSLIGLEPAVRPVTSLFQQHNLFNHLNVWKNIALGVSPTLGLSSQERQQISELLHSVGLGGYDEKSPLQLSGGEQQRVALARCLLRRKPVLLLDEPFSALDSTTRKEMIELLHQLIARFEPCVLMITHDEADALAINATILDMHDEGAVFRQ